MRRLFSIYILVLLALGVACQRVDLPDNPQVNQPVELPTGEIGSKVTIAFSTADVTGPETRGVVDPRTQVETLHLIVFDENGMLVEVCEATEYGSSDHDEGETGGTHTGGRYYTVTLTVTDKPRIIHYVANCDVNQVVYGHEISVIGNMFVDRNGSKGAKTIHEVSYWARIEVPYIFVTKEVNNNGTVVVSLVDEIKGKFEHVPLLRNYAEITVTDKTDDTFYFEGFTVYNLLNRGTVAPYNSNTHEFQSFFERDGETITKKYLYPEMCEFGYEGHALTSAQLITDLVRNPDGTIKEFKPGEPFYVYERKVSVMTDEEEKWRESPPHIIIKGKYNNGDTVDSINSKSYYYKMDLVYTEGTDGNEEIKYYNILRNFKYQFNLTDVYDVGYETLEEAVAGAAGNNISGSSTTSKMTNISDSEGRLWVSYTDITLVTDDSVVFRYKYAPNYYTNKDDIQNGLVKFQNYEGGEVIKGFEVAKSDASDGWREVTIHVNKPDDITRQQILYLKTDNVNLSRQIRHTLRKKLTMQVECTPKVKGEILQEVQVDIKLPPGMTEDMFPLKLDMETLNRTLSPHATKNDDPIPVTAGPSIVPERVGQSSYYYTVTIPTFDAYYNELPKDGDMRVVTTHWQTNMAANASTFYVANKYFNLASDSWRNYTYEFANVSCSSSAVGVDQNVTISFSMADGAINKPVTIYLEGMTFTGPLDGVNYTDATEVTYTPSRQNVSIGGFKTTTATDAVSFTLDADNYNIFGPVEGERQTYKFNGAFAADNLAVEANAKVDFTFDIDPDALEALKKLYPEAGADGVPMYVTLDRLQPADDQLVYSQAKAGGDRYIYRIKQSGTQTIKLATTSADVGDCTVTLQADYFDTQNVTIQQRNIVTYSGTIKISDVLNFGNNNNLQTNSSYDSSATYSITVDGKKVDVTGGTLTYTTSKKQEGKKYYITGISSFNIPDVSISGEELDDKTEVSIEITITTNYGSRKVTHTSAISSLGLSKQ